MHSHVSGHTFIGLFVAISPSEETHVYLPVRAGGCIQPGAGRSPLGCFQQCGHLHWVLHPRRCGDRVDAMLGLCKRKDNQFRYFSIHSQPREEFSSSDSTLTPLLAVLNFHPDLSQLNPNLHPGPVTT